MDLLCPPVGWGPFQREVAGTCSVVGKERSKSPPSPILPKLRLPQRKKPMGGGSNITRVVGSSLRKFPACWFLPRFAVINPLPLLPLSIFGFRGTRVYFTVVRWQALHQGKVRFGISSQPLSDVTLSRSLGGPYFLSNEGIISSTHNMQEIFSCHRKKLIVKGTNFMPQLKISCHWKNCPNYCYFVRLPSCLTNFLSESIGSQEVKYFIPS